MAADTPKRDTSQKAEPKRRRMSLMESYDARSGAFSDGNLSQIASKIRAITSPITNPLGEPIDELTEDSIGESIGTPVHSLIKTPIDSPIESPDTSSNLSPTDSPTDSPIAKPNLSPDDSPIVLTENQAVLYFCIRILEGSPTSLNCISRATNISEHTLKSCLKKLRKVKAIHYHGRTNFGGRIGFSADVITREVIISGDRHRLQQQLEQIDQRRLGFAQTIENSVSIHPLNHPMQHLIAHQTPHRMTPPMDHPIVSPPCSSNKEQLLQELVLEAAFESLNPKSLIPHLVHIDSTEMLQDYLDMANACIAAANAGEGTPIRNPYGFLVAQLKAGYINPPDGYKSRKVRAQEARNLQLQAELDELRRLKEEEKRLRFEVFKARLTTDDAVRLEKEAQSRVDRRSPVSADRQVDVAREEILREWFSAQGV